MIKIRNIRSRSQQLNECKHTTPKLLVSWMGAVQAQDYQMAKWALGLRLGNTTDQRIEEAFDKGEILRTHVMRPTWHFVANEDIRWMLALSKGRIRTMFLSGDKKLGLDASIYSKCNKVLENALADNNHLTREEITIELDKAKIGTNSKTLLYYIMMQAEIDGVICSGAMRGKKHTYALLDERAPMSKLLSKEESLALLATRYFRSHSPASMQDFVWWSGLTTKDAKLAIATLGTGLIEDQFGDNTVYTHESYTDTIALHEQVHLLPSYDEYIISYKNREAVLSLDHSHKAHNTFGIFYPIIAYNGKIVGNWKKIVKKNEIDFDISFFDNTQLIPVNLLEEAKENYKRFILK